MFVSSKYCNIAWICSASPKIVAANAMDSASDVDLATELCFRETQCTGKKAEPVCTPMMILLVDFADHGHEAKSASLKARTIGTLSNDTVPTQRCVQVWCT